VNGKYYYGIHSTNNLNDSYRGRGTAIVDAIKKYGKENFTKEIIADYPIRKEASDHEKRVVTMELVKSTECYNLRTGGDNEYIHIITDETRKKLSSAKRNISNETRLKMSKANTGKNNNMFGKKISEETRTKLIEVRKNISNETRLKMSKSQLGRKHRKETLVKIATSNSKKCIVDDILYNSYNEAALAFNVTHCTVSNRIKSENNKWAGWKNYEEVSCLN